MEQKWNQSTPIDTPGFNLEVQDARGQGEPKGTFSSPTEAMERAEQLGVENQRWRFFRAPRSVWRNW